MTAAPTVLQTRVLVLMPTPKDAERTTRFLEQAHVPCLPCRDETELAREIEDGAGAVLVASEAFESDHGTLEATLQRQTPGASVPLIVLSRPDTKARFADKLSDPAWNGTLVERPVRAHTLINVVKATLRAREQQYAIRDALLERARQAAALREKDARLHFALDAGKLGWWEVEFPSGRMTCSDPFKWNFGRTPGEAFEYDDMLASIHPDDSQWVRAAIQRSLAERSDYDVEYRNVWVDGQVHWVMVRGRPTYRPDGTPLRMVGVSLDITDRKEAQAALSAQADQLMRSDQQKDEFLATLAHELRNPLAPIRTGVDVLKRAPDSVAAHRALGMMDRQLAHMVRLIDDLMDLSRITRGKVELRKERVSLQQIVAAAVEATRPLVEMAGHELTVKVSGEAIYMEADPTRLVQIVNNLLNNAAKYTDEGGQIEVRGSATNGTVIIEVQDNGEGIPKDQLGAVFEMFSQVNRTLDRAQGGLGIGLALVRRLVEMHGGSIEAKSDGNGLGSTFTVRLPEAPPEEELIPQRDTPVSSKEPTKRVLVVDDNQDAAECLSMLLEITGHRTEMAHSGQDALAIATRFDPDIVFLDIGLPDIDGYEVARQLRKMPNLARTVLVAVTGWGSEEDRRRSSEAGFDHHLTKPVETRTVEEMLAKVRPRGASQSGYPEALNPDSLPSARTA